jgi:uncharacterized membrane protein YhhN
VPTLRTATKLKIGYLGVAAVDTWLSGLAHPMAHRARFLTKPLLMPALAGSLATNPKASGSPLRSTTLVAQTAGWGGDVALLASGTKPFLVGAGSFAVGHAAYLAGFLRRRNHEPLREPLELRVIAGSWLVSAPALTLLARRQQRELGAPVFGYATILAAMVIGAHRLDADVPTSARRLTMAGASLFMVSDTLLALRKFALQDPPAELERAVMATYAAGQFLLSEGAARA